MNWNEIEAKWTAMARRVRADRVLDDDNKITSAPVQSQQDGLQMQAPKPLDRPAA